MEIKLLDRCLRWVAIMSFILLVTGCSMYPLGDSHYPHYFGGHGSAVDPTGYVPAELQRVNTFPQ
jgi:hypothetical protein